MKALGDLGAGLTLPLDAVTQRFAFLGRTGSGKSHGAGRLAELMLEAGAQVVVLDMVGIWYGLRLSADGKRPGHPIAVLGGDHGDVPIEPGAGAAVADAVVDGPTSAVVDLSPFSKGKRELFVADFAERFFQRKKQRRSPVHLIIEEAQRFAPQNPRPDERRMLGAVEDLTRLGRNYGIGVTLISQRPQSINKEVLNQSEVLVVLQMAGAHEVKAIQDWIKEAGAEGKDAEWAADLPSLPPGTAYVWSPSWLRLFRKVRIHRRLTFDAGATPTFGAEEVRRELAPIDLVALRASMAEVVRRAAEEDPKALRARVRDLEAQVRRLGVAKAPAEPRVVEKIVPVLDERAVRDLERAVGGFLPLRDALGLQHQALVEMLAGLRARVAAAPTTKVQMSTLYGVMRRPAGSVEQETRRPREGVERMGAPPRLNGDLGRCERELLRALASRHPAPLNRTQVATLSGYSRNSSGFANAMSRLNTGGYIEKRGADTALTAAGLAAAGPVDAPDSPGAVLDLWAGKLPGKEAQMLRALVSAGSAGLSRDDLAVAVDLSPTSSGYANYLSHLNSNGLVQKAGGAVMAADLLLP